MGVVEVAEGDFNGLDLAGARFAMVYAWPGPVFEGGGQMTMIIDDRCSNEQAKALEQIGSGRETVEASTVWWVYATMCDTHHEVLRARIDLDIDMDTRTARCNIDGVLEASAEPIRSPLDGSPHRPILLHKRDDVDSPTCHPLSDPRVTTTARRHEVGRMNRGARVA